MRVIFLGPPGAGKGTQARVLAERSGFPQISTGDLLRGEREKKSAFGKKAESYMRQGILVPDEIVEEMVAERLTQRGCRKGYILDGFPRSLHQAESLRGDHQVIFLEVRDEELMTRLTGRRREDDTEAVVRKRLEVYRRETAPVVAYYEKKGRLTRVLGEGTIEEIGGRIQGVLGP